MPEYIVDSINEKQDTIYYRDLIVHEDIRVQGHLEVKGRLICSGSIHVDGFIRVSNSLEVSEDLQCGQFLEVRKWLEAGNDVHANDWIEVGDVLEAGGDIRANEWISAVKSIHSGGIIAAGKYISVLGMQLQAKTIEAPILHFKKSFLSVRKYWAAKAPFIPYKSYIMNPKWCLEDILGKISQEVDYGSIITWNGWTDLERLSIQLAFQHFGKTADPMNEGTTKVS